MALTVTHPFVSAVVDDGVAGEVGPSEWNQAHTVGGTVDSTQMPALTGDVTTSAGSTATTLATVNANVGTFGSATQASVVTVNAKGLVTAASNATVAPAVGSITGLGSGVATFLATPSSANLAAAVTDEAGSGALLFASAIDNTKITTIPFIIDGGGAVITTGLKGDLQIDFACTINAVTLLADLSGTFQVDIWKDTYANYPPTAPDSICASATPTLSSAIKSTDSTLTGWTKSIAAGDTLRFNVTVAATCQRVTVSLKVTKT